MEQVGGADVADKIRRTLAGHNPKGQPFSVGRRAGYLLRHCTAVVPKNPRARLLYLTLADLTTLDTDGRPKPVTVTHKKLAAWLTCSTRQVSRFVRELEFGPLPLITATPGRQGRPSRFLFIVDPIDWAVRQEAERAATLARRRERKTRTVATAYIQQAAGALTDNQVAEVERQAAQRERWRVPPSRMERFRSRLAS